MEFPFVTYTDVELLEEYNNLSLYGKNLTSIKKFIKKRLGYKCSNAFFQYERMNTSIFTRKSCIEFWKDKKNRDIVIKNSQKKPIKTLFNTIQFINHCPSQFPPSIAIQVYKYFNPRHVLDPFAGWGDRCIAAMSMNLNYTGVDSNKNLKPYYKDMVSFYPSKSKVKMFYKSCDKVDLDKVDFDLVLTSPPYWTEKNKCIENYNFMPQSDYKKFMDSILIPMIHKCRLKANWSCFNIPENMALYIQNNYGKWQKVISYSASGNKTYQDHKIYCFESYQQ
jgi:16S rRNA G966 N2-methylase RsmD